MVKCTAPDCYRWIRKLDWKRIGVDQSGMIKNICDYQKKTACQMWKDLSYDIYWPNQSSSASRSLFHMSPPFSITLFDQPPRVLFFWKWFIEKVFSYCRLLTLRSTQKRKWTFFLRVILTRKTSVERKAPKLDADRSWWLINLLADTAGLDLYLNTDVFIFLFCISVLLSAEGTRLYIWPEYCGASFTSTFTAGL